MKFDQSLIALKKNQIEHRKLKKHLAHARPIGFFSTNLATQTQPKIVLYY